MDRNARLFSHFTLNHQKIKCLVVNLAAIFKNVLSEF